MISLMSDALSRFERTAAAPAMLKRATNLVSLFLTPGRSRSMIRQLQAQRLRRSIAYAAHRSPFYRELFGRQRIRPEHLHTLEDLRSLPCTTSHDLHAWQRFVCVSPGDLAAVFTTSGTTGEPKRVYYSYRDMQALTNIAALGLRLFHPGPLVALIALPLRHGLWIGTATAQRIVERAGGLPIPVGAEDPRETLTWMQRFTPTLVCSSPSYWTALTHEAERQGYQVHLDTLLLGGEPLAPAQKTWFRAYWGAQILDSYGSTEIGGGQTIALPQCTAFNLNDFHLVTEIIDPQTGQPADEGELVFTTLGRSAMPLLRYRSGDRACWSHCPCGMPLSTVRLAGRLDDLLVTGDMNLYGHILAEAVAHVAGASGRIALLLDTRNMIDRLVVQVEGSGIAAEAVRQALFAVYPEMPGAIASGRWDLEVRTGVDLGTQIKAFKIVDARASASATSGDAERGEADDYHL